MATYVIKEGQSIFDLALQLYGDVSKAYELIGLNDSINNITSNDLEGIEITYEEQKNEVTEFFKTNSLTISTRYPEFTTGESFDDSFDDSFL